MNRVNTAIESRQTAAAVQQTQTFLAVGEKSSAFFPGRGEGVLRGYSDGKVRQSKIYLKITNYSAESCIIKEKLLFGQLHKLLVPRSCFVVVCTEAQVNHIF